MGCMTDDCIDLLYSLLDLSEETDFSNAEELLYEKYGVDFDKFETLIEDLLDYTPIVETAITNTKVHALQILNQTQI